MITKDDLIEVIARGLTSNVEPKIKYFQMKKGDDVYIGEVIVRYLAGVQIAWRDTESTNIVEGEDRWNISTVKALAEMLFERITKATQDLAEDNGETDEDESVFFSVESFIKQCKVSADALYKCQTLMTTPLSMWDNIELVPVKAEKDKEPLHVRIHPLDDITVSWVMEDTSTNSPGDWCQEPVLDAIKNIQGKTLEFVQNMQLESPECIQTQVNTISNILNVRTVFHHNNLVEEDVVHRKSVHTGQNTDGESFSVSFYIIDHQTVVWRREGSGRSPGTWAFSHADFVWRNIFSDAIERLRENFKKLA